MLSVDFLSDLYRHMEWADATVWRTIQHADSIVADEYVHSTLHHLHATQRAFMNFWTGVEIERPDPTRFANLSEIRQWSLSFYREASVFLAALERADLERPAVVPWVRYFERRIGRSANQTNLGETLFQVTMHSAYHRGQVNRRLRELGLTPPLVDYIAWVWSDRPDAENQYP